MSCVITVTTEVEAFVSTNLPNAVHLETYNGNVAMVIINDVYTVIYVAKYLTFS